MVARQTLVPSRAGAPAPARSSVTVSETVIVWSEEVTSTDVEDRLMEL